MTHDPLCSREGDPFRTGWCNVCILIKAVREDERARIKQAVESLGLTGGWTTPDGVIHEVDRAAVLSIIDGDADA